MKKNNNQIYTLADYLKKINIENQENDMIDVRFYFFYLKKLQKLMVMRKSVTANPRKTCTCASTTVIKELSLNKPITSNSISSLSSKEMADFIMTNSEKILYNDSFLSTIGETQTRVDTFSDGRDPAYALEYFLVSKPFRNEGLGSLLINEAKNSSINNNIYKLSGEIMPIDDQPKHFLELRKLINELSKKTGRFKNLSYVDYDTLRKIYSSLGFSIIDNPRYTNPRLEMILNTTSVPEDKKLPDEFTRFLKNKHTTILFA